MKTQSDWQTKTRAWPGSVSKIAWLGKAAPATRILCPHLHFTKKKHFSQILTVWFITQHARMSNYLTWIHAPGPSVLVGFMSVDIIQGHLERGNLNWVIASIWWAVDMSYGIFLNW